MSEHVLAQSTSQARAAIRAKSHLLDQARRRAGELVAGPTGLWGVFDARWPVSHLSNRVLVTAGLSREATLTEVLAFTNEVSADRGLKYRKVDVLDEALGLKLTDGLVAAGYGHAPVLLMVADQPPAASPSLVTVDAVPESAVRTLVEKGWHLEAPDFTADTVSQLVGRRDALDDAGDVTRLVVRDPATQAVVAKADLLISDRVAQIDDVLTLPDHRGRGYASALVLDAAARAQAQGADLVYLEAAEDDWPKELYARLGFVVADRIHEHTLVDVASTE